MKRLRFSALVSVLSISFANSTLAFELGQHADACMTGYVANTETNTNKESYLGCKVEVVEMNDAQHAPVRVRPLSLDLEACKMMSFLFSEGLVYPAGAPPLSLEGLVGPERSMTDLHNSMRLYEDGGLTIIPNSKVAVCEKADH